MRACPSASAAAVLMSTRHPLALLRARRERPRNCRPSNSFNEIAAAHIILPQVRRLNGILNAALVPHWAWRERDHPLMRSGSLIIVAALVAAIPALAHSWYPLACCGDMDCFLIACDRTAATWTGKVDKSSWDSNKQAALTSTPSPGSGGEPDLRSTLNTGSLHRRLQFWRRCEGSGLVGGTEVVGDGHVVRVVDGRIDSLADHAQLPPCGVEGVVNFTPGRVVGHLVTDENANAHVRITSYRLYVAKAFSMSLPVVGFKICTDLAGARAGHVLTTSVMRR